MDKVWLKKYFRQVNGKLVGTRNEKTDFMNGFTNDVTSYIELHPDCTSDDILLQFGKPEDISKEFISVLDEETLRKQIRRKMWFRILFAAALTALVIFAFFYVQDMHYFFHGHYDDTITVGYFSDSTDFPDSLGSY